MTDKLEEAKQYFHLVMNTVITEYGIGIGHWLISELEKCRAENEMFQGDVVRLQQTNRRLNRRCTEMEGALKKAEAEVRRLKSILANQGTEF